VGLRSPYFLLAGARGRFAYLDAGLALILSFIGAERRRPHRAGVSLGVIVVVIGAAIAASLLRSRRPRDA